MKKNILFISILSFILSLFLFGCASTSNHEDMAQFHLQLGLGFLNKARYPEAIRELHLADNELPDNPSIQNNLGLAYYYRDRKDLAVKYLRKAVVLDPKYSDAKNNLARVLIELDENAEAKKLLNEVLADLTYPYLNRTYINLGILHFKENNFTEAYDVLTQAMTHDKENCLANKYYGRTLLELKKDKLAAEVLDRAKQFCRFNNEVETRDDEPEYFAALAYYRLGDRARAESRFKSVINLSGPYSQKAEKMLNLLKKVK